MKLVKRSLLVLSSVLLASSTAAAAERPINTRILGTRAIVACDTAEGTCGMAVISFPSGVSGLVPYGRPDIAVASMSLPSVDDANAIIARIDSGEAPQAAIDGVLAADPLAAIRQFAVVKVNADGTVSVGQRSGDSTSDFTCSIKGATYVVQANNMSTGDMCRAMAEGFENARGSLPMRLLASLKAGALVGGDNNGERSGVIRAWNSTSPSAFYTHVLADAVTHASPTALQDLEVELYRYLGVIAPAHPEDAVVLDAKAAKTVKRVLRKLAYYDGPMDGTWSAAADKALGDFTWNNCFNDKPTTVVDGVRRIDGVLVSFLRTVNPEALAPATPPAQ